MGKSLNAFNKGISSALESLKERGDVSLLVADELRTTVEAIKTKIERQKKLDREIKQLARGCKNYENFLKTPGASSYTATMLCVLLCDPSIFANGRRFAAYIGLVWYQEAEAQVVKTLLLAYHRNSIVTANPGQYLLSMLKR